MEVEIVSKEAIKPSKPTPSHNKLYTLSCIDQLSPSVYVPVLLFYQAPSTRYERAALCSQLKNSLSETLTHYYPFAGKFKEGGAYIDCDDEGALFLEVRAERNLADILTFPKLEAFTTLFPERLPGKSSKNSSVLAIQLSYFDCGGFSIGICISHKIADACTIVTFLNDWASQARLSGKDCSSISPLFNTASTFPPVSGVLPDYEMKVDDVVTRRYVFYPTEITELKAVIASNSEVLRNPTRVEAVSSLISKAIIEAIKVHSTGLIKAYKLGQIVNLRPRMVPPLPGNSIGNVIWYFAVAIRDNDDISLESLTAKMREGLVNLSDFAKKVEGKDWFSVMAVDIEKDRSERSMGDAYIFSSWCKLPIYEVDFGRGTPAWVSRAVFPYKNTIFLMDTKDGGIEAYLTLNEEMMYIVEADEEFLEFASLNPSI